MTLAPLLAMLLSKRWFTLLCLAILASGCATAELTRRPVDGPAGNSYRHILLSVDLSDSVDTLYLTDRLIKQLEQRDLQAITAQITSGASIHDVPGSALLSIEELERRIVTVEYHRSYGRTSLTQMRGRKTADVPVITLRTTLIDAASQLIVFQADYVTRGPWYADSATVVAALAATLVEQLEHEGFIPAKYTISK